MDAASLAIPLTGVLLVASCLAASAEEGVARRVPAEPWDARNGNHRAVIRVDEATDAVRVHRPWRRRDREPQNKAVWVIEAATGERVNNAVAVDVNREFGDVVFQVGLFAARSDLDDVCVSFDDLRGRDGAAIPASALRCFNAGGIDWLGRAFAKTIAVPKGNVQALWIGVDVPRDLPAGTYAGTVAIAPEGQKPTDVELSLAVSAQLLEDRGDSELWRMSRLR